MTYAINIGDILHDHDSEPPPGTVIELADGEQWKRLPDTTRWCWAAQHQDYRGGRLDLGTRHLRPPGDRRRRPRGRARHDRPDQQRIHES